MKLFSKVTRGSGQGIERLLGDLELAVMEHIWTNEWVTVRDVLNALNRKRSLAYTTVMTVMSRLADKGLLLIEKQGKAYTYKAALTREEFESRVAAQIIQALIADFGGDIALSQFVKELSGVDPGKLARLAEMARLAQEEQGDER